MPPTTPRLLPGLLVLRRSRQQWQVGLRHRLRLDDSPELRACVGESTGQLDGRAGTRLVAELQRAGVLLDPVAAGVLRPPYGDAAQRRAARDLAAAVLRHGRDVEQAVRARSTEVRVLRHGPAAEDVAAEVDRFLGAVGSGGLRDCGEESPDASPVLVVSDGEPPRELLDDLLRSRTPHLILRIVESAVVLGPFVHPGLTGCLRCEDLHRARTDPAWPLLVAQAARRGGAPRPDGVATPADALTVTAVAALAARDLVRSLEGLEPDSWSAELVWDEPVGPSHHTITRHAACACACWEVAGVSAEQGAEQGAG